MSTGGKRIRFEPELTCRQARKQIRAQGRLRPQGGIAETGDLGLTAHLSHCDRCEAEARINRLYRAIVCGDARPAGAEDVPDATWFRGLMARIEREGLPSPQVAEDSFAGIVWLAARQMVPAMVALVLLIVGATLFWNRAPNIQPGTNDPVLMNQVVEYPQPTSDDVLGTLLAVEDKKNGK
jgi:hypothetical protein